MSISNARRIVVLIEVRGMSLDELAKAMGCSVDEASASYEDAKAATIVADARKTVRKLNELANELGMTANELLAAFS